MNTHEISRKKRKKSKEQVEYKEENIHQNLNLIKEQQIRQRKSKKKKKKGQRKKHSAKDKLQAKQQNENLWEEQRQLKQKIFLQTKVQDNERNEKAPIVHDKSKNKRDISLKDSQKIIYIFSLDAGDYKELKEQLPHIGQRLIRSHLKTIFQYCLDLITEGQKNGRKIKQWQLYEKRQIIRQLHRIRSSNRLLSESNEQVRNTFHKIMSTYNHPEITISQDQITFLYRKIEAFVRGFNHSNFFRKNLYIPPDQQDQRRKPLIQGGYIMQSKIKRQHKKTESKLKLKVSKIDPDRLILQWKEQQERELGQLYLSNVNYEYIIQNLTTKFGEDNKWKDFQILSKKIDHIIKMGLNRLQELTYSQSAYKREEKMVQDNKKMERKDDEYKRRRIERIKRFGYQDLQESMEVVYNNKEERKEEIKEGGVITNPWLLLRQTFAHHVESFRVRQALVSLVIDKYPEEEHLVDIIQTIKQFTEWASKEQETNHVTLVRRRPPVLQDRVKQKAAEVYVKSMIKQQSQESLFQCGLHLLQDEIKSQLESRYGNYRYGGNEHKLQVSFKQEPRSDRQESVIAVLQSDESQYQGFISSSVDRKYSMKAETK